MSSPKTPQKRTSKFNSKLITVQESNSQSSFTNKQESAKSFITWYKQLIDNERQKIGLFLSDDVTLKWFGRTVRSRKKVYSFFTSHVECSRHYLTSVETIAKVQIRQNRSPRKSDSILVSPSYSPDIKTQRQSKRRLVDSPSTSPQWAPGCKPDDDSNGTKTKRSKQDKVESMDSDYITEHNGSGVYESNSLEFNKGDGLKRRKHEDITPPALECGQGDCLPSTSSDSDKSHETLNAQLPKLAVECNGYIEFTRTRHSRADNVKWERKCKLQICYSEDPLNVGEFVIWTICYSDESKCRRNLLSEFDEVAKEESS